MMTSGDFGFDPGGSGRCRQGRHRRTMLTVIVGRHLILRV
jgi:hypothetical protein